jgi:hypothetical protein
VAACAGWPDDIRTFRLDRLVDEFADEAAAHNGKHFRLRVPRVAAHDHTLHGSDCLSAQEYELT